MADNCFIIAEAGINHNGNYDVAKELVDAAVYAGADAVKFQTWMPGELRYKNIGLIDTIRLSQYCDYKHILFLSTPHSFKAIDFLDDIVPMYKIASPFLLNHDFLYRVASKKKTVLLSTGSLKHEDGMATDTEISDALLCLRGTKVILMHCVSKYPCIDPCLYRIDELKEFGKEVGLSDHTKNTVVDVDVPVIEKHLMLPGVECVDSNVSLTPDEFRMLVKHMRGRQ